MRNLLLVVLVVMAGSFAFAGEGDGPCGNPSQNPPNSIPHGPNQGAPICPPK